MPAPAPGPLKTTARPATRIVAAIICFFAATGIAHAADMEDLEQHPGYLSDVGDERSDVSQEFIILPMPDPADKTKLIDQIFTQKLTNDLSKQYRTTFGYTEYEQVEYTSNRFVDVTSDDSNRLTPVNEYISLQNSYGKYMIRAIADYHVDNYLKNNHDLKTIYETKQKLSNMEYKTSSGQKIKVRYNIANGTTTVSMEKPEEKFHKSVDFQVGTSPNTVARMSYDFTKTVNVEQNYAYENQTYSLIAKRKLRANLSTSVTFQDFGKDVNTTTPKQTRLLFGVSWND
jgi:hypothetical protein